MNPHPEILEDLCKTYPRIERADILACWQNAQRLWTGMNPAYLVDEPAELTAARTLFVHASFVEFSDDTANYSYAMWSLIVPYTINKR